MMHFHFAFLLLLSGASQLSEVSGFSTSQPPLTRTKLATTSPLFQLRADTSGNPPKGKFSSARRVVQSKKPSQKQWSLHASRWLSKVRRSVTVSALAIVVWFGAAGIRTPASHASTVTTAVSESKNIISASFDQIVSRYVKNHMFDDDVYEPVESVYREATMDKTQGAYPKALREVTASVLGKDGVKAEKSSSSNGIGDMLLKAVSFLQRKGLTESMAIIVLTGSFVVAGPLAFLIGGMMVGSQSKRQLNNTFKKRYGDTYTVDATVKVEDDVEVPDDDDEDDNNADDDDDDNDDDDDEYEYVSVEEDVDIPGADNGDDYNDEWEQ